LWSKQESGYVRSSEYILAFPPRSLEEASERLGFPYGYSKQDSLKSEKERTAHSCWEPW
jgi:hypothetical protein